MRRACQLQVVCEKIFATTHSRENERAFSGIFQSCEPEWRQWRLQDRGAVWHCNGMSLGADAH
jgi:hypothetical protein